MLGTLLKLGCSEGRPRTTPPRRKVVFHSVMMYSLALLIVVVLTTGGRAMAIEKAKYQTLESDGDFELRQYEPSIVAETMVDGEFDGAANEGVRRLVAYINGKNRKKASISMTAWWRSWLSATSMTLSCPGDPSDRFLSTSARLWKKSGNSSPSVQVI